MRVVVFGSSGMVGASIVTMLRNQPQLSVIAESRTETALRLDDLDYVGEVLRGSDLAVNAVGILRNHPSYPDDDYRRLAIAVNSTWPIALSRIAAESGTRVFHVSTDAVFAPGTEALGEDAAVGPTEPYGLSKAMGEATAPHVLNVRCSVVGPTRRGGRSLWDWLLSQSKDAVVSGYATYSWTGCTNAQLARLVQDLVKPESFDSVRSTGSCQHFVPNEAITKFELLTEIARRFRPDLTVVPIPEIEPSLGRPLASQTGALRTAFSGVMGWDHALDELKSQ